jgi:hypothetical protein
MPSIAALVVALAVAATAAGCGSQAGDQLPAPAGPAPAPTLRAVPAGRVAAARVPLARRLAVPLDGRRTVVLRPRARRLELLEAGSRRRGAQAPAGVGPTNVACLRAGPCYVVDTRGDALLVYAVHPDLELVRRVFLPGAPYAIAIDARRRRMFVTLTARNEVVQLPAHGRPHVLRRWPTVRQPNAVAVDRRTGVVLIAGVADGVRQTVRP